MRPNYVREDQEQFKPICNEKYLSKLAAMGFKSTEKVAAIANLMAMMSHSALLTVTHHKSFVH